MRKLVILLATLLISLPALGAPLLAADNKMVERIFMERKDVCLLFAMNCNDNAYQVQQRIKQLQTEILRGYAVYSDEELRILTKKLDEAKRTLKFLITEGA